MLKKTALNLTFVDISTDPGAFKCLKEAPKFLAKLVNDQVLISAITSGPQAPEPVSITKNVFKQSFTTMAKTDKGHVVIRTQTPMSALQIDTDFVVEDKAGKHVGKPGDYVVRSHDGTNIVVAQAEFGARFVPLGQVQAKTRENKSPTLH